MYVLTSPENTVLAYPYSYVQLCRDNPGTSFPAVMPDERLAEWFVFPVVPTSQPSVDYTQNLTMGEPVLADGVWTQTWIVTPASPEEIAEREAEMRQANKQQASTLLTETDYTDLPNTASRIANLKDMLAYRDTLRSIAINPPLTVSEWPTKPDTIWVDSV